MALGVAVGSPIDTPDAWEELVEWLPKMLQELLESDVFDRLNRPPSDRRGVYLFSEHGRHLYVGRTGITARSRARVDVPPITGFRHRYDQHIQPGRPPGASSFARRLTLERAAELGLVVPNDWWKHRAKRATELYEIYKEEKRRIGAMQCRVVSFEDDLKGVRSTVAEAYVHTQLLTAHNDFSTS
jgi:hypothetical protein